MSCKPVTQACARPEIWGGFECSIVRIGDTWRNQIVETGHFRREDDIDRLADLGIKTMRYPLLWEMSEQSADGWSWMDGRMRRMKALHVRPIAGLVHHGSGPQRVNLLSRDFAYGLARHARETARRFPWIDAYTPVNEPLTTARFSTLYGHWYPHERNSKSFLKAVFNQCLGVVLAMREIRRIRPDAVLVQTEDLGRVFSTAPLAEQASYENERRWLSLDLLCGRVTSKHPFYLAFRSAGISDHDLAEFQDERAAPDIIGINHYLTSDRYLDHRLRDYPPEAIGGNGRQVYADVAAARARINVAEWGPGPRFMEAWQRYARPIAITEVHNGSTIDEQLRWVETVYQSVLRCRASGADIRAVTAWASFGAVDWPSLLTRQDDHYESGLFDIRHGAPRPSALAAIFEKLATLGECAHPVLDEAKQGWWRRADRYHRRAKRQAILQNRKRGRRTSEALTSVRKGQQQTG